MGGVPREGGTPETPGVWALGTPISACVWGRRSPSVLGAPHKALPYRGPHDHPGTWRYPTCAWHVGKEDPTSPPSYGDGGPPSLPFCIGRGDLISPQTHGKGCPHHRHVHGEGGPPSLPCIWGGGIP